MINYYDREWNIFLFCHLFSTILMRCSTYTSLRAYMSAYCLDTNPYNKLPKLTVKIKPIFTWLLPV